jgi:CRP-like cAMP-binding protein
VRLTYSPQDHFLFQTLEPQDLIQVVDSMLKVEADEGASVITQGDMGSDFLVLYAGTCDIVVDGERIGEYTAPACFGELALMYSARRAATIRATSTSVLYSLGLKYALLF